MHFEPVSNWNNLSEAEKGKGLPLCVGGDTTDQVYSLRGFGSMNYNELCLVLDNCFRTNKTVALDKKRLGGQQKMENYAQLGQDIYMQTTRWAHTYMKVEKNLSGSRKYMWFSMWLWSRGRLCGNDWSTLPCPTDPDLEPHNGPCLHYSPGPSLTQ